MMTAVTNNGHCVALRERRLLALGLHFLPRCYPRAVGPIGVHTRDSGWSTLNHVCAGSAASGSSDPPVACEWQSVANSPRCSNSQQRPRSFDIPDPVTYGGSLTGIGVNLLVSELDWSAMLAFVREILCLPLATVGENFAVLRHEGVDMLFHRDDTYGSSPGAVAERTRATAGIRGLGVELRLYNLEPQDVEARAKTAGFSVLQTTTTKPHGLVECYIQGPGSFVWVPSCPTKRMQPESRDK